MKLTIERGHLDQVVGAFPALETLRAQRRFDEKAELPVAQLSDAQMAFLCDLYRRAGPECQVRAACPHGVPVNYK